MKLKIEVPDFPLVPYDFICLLFYSLKILIETWDIHQMQCFKMHTSAQKKQGFNEGLNQSAWYLK